MWGNTLTYSGTPLQELVYIHYLNCFLDLVHTIFLIVLKKYDHLSFLHVYVRLLLLWNWYVVAEFGAYGDSYFGALTQSIAAFVCFCFGIGTSLQSLEPMATAILVPLLKVSLPLFAFALELVRRCRVWSLWRQLFWCPYSKYR